MDAIIEFLTGYGYTGMFIASLLAGSVLPFSSEAVMVGLMAAGLDPWLLALYGTIGNVIGSMVNYWVGHMGKTEWFERYLHVKPRDMERAERFMAGRGALMGFFAFLPVIGSAITILLGLMRANLLITFLAVTAGKIVRYLILIYGAGLFL
jgi:membrane protein YqaA with SNARE-associated domain